MARMNLLRGDDEWGSNLNELGYIVMFNCCVRSQ